MKILKANADSIKEAAEFIKAGKLVAFPTETVYGLGADAFNPIAVAKIFEVKRRPSFDPLIVHIADFSIVDKLSSYIPNKAKELIERFWPGPLTIVVKKTPLVPDIVTAGLSTVAIRMPKHPVAKAIIEEAGTPIAAPSANIFGRISPTTAEHVIEQLNDSIDLIIDGGSCPLGIESTVIEITDFTEEVVLLRPGSLPVEEIEKILGPVKKNYHSKKQPRCPGQLKKHYSPNTPIKFITEHHSIANKDKAGLLVFTPKEEVHLYKAAEILSLRGDLCEAAANLFQALHRLDKANVEIIYVEPLPEEGLGRAIMDRLYKAAGIEKNE